jgi:uncharacterized protein (TIGR03435 family)
MGEPWVGDAGLHWRRLLPAAAMAGVIMFGPAGWMRQADGQAQADGEKVMAMAPDASPSFLVATIKPTDPKETREGFPGDDHHIMAVNETVATILSIAYSIHGKQIVGGPEWISKDHWDINGIPDLPGTPNLKQTQEMFQKLLADRFHMALHVEKRAMPIYAITIAPGGPMLTPADPNEIHINTGNRDSGGQRTLKFSNISMADMALNLNFYESRPVIDETGLKGRYNFTLTWTYDPSKESEAGAPPSLVTAMKEQLGLKMEAVKGPADVYVIDHVERPSEN